MNFCCLSPLVYGILLWLPEPTKTVSQVTERPHQVTCLPGTQFTYLENGRLGLEPWVSNLVLTLE